MKRKYFGYGLGRTLMFCMLLAFFGNLAMVQAQKLMQRRPGKLITCPAIFKDANSRMGMEQAAAVQAAILDRPATADIQITFGPGAEGNEDVRNAFEFALAIWSREIVSSVPIRVIADFADLGPGVLASAGPTGFFSNFPGAPEEDVFYPTALANSLAGVDLDPDTEFDLVVNLGNGIPFYFGTDGNPPPGLFDFVTIALHEAGHGLGFIALTGVDGGVGNIANGQGLDTFSQFIVDGNGVRATDLGNPSSELGDFLVSNNLFVDGQFAAASLGGTLPRLFAPNPFQGGSSIAHWDEATFPPGDPNSLMTPAAGPAESNFDIGDATRGHFRDMGWVIANQAPVAVAPQSATFDLPTEESTTLEFNITNIAVENATVSIAAGEGSTLITAIEPSEVQLTLAEGTTFQVTFSAAGISSGVFNESIVVTTAESDLVTEIPITVRVLDGSEVPLISVNPESFTETLQQFQFVSRDLEINNAGIGDLEFEIMVDGAAIPDFSEMAEATQTAIDGRNFNLVEVGSGSSDPQAQILTVDGQVTNIVTDLFATGFEEFVEGDIVGQGGWFARFENNFTVSSANAFEGNQHFRGVSDGLGADRPAAPLALSPAFPLGNAPMSVLTAQLNIQGEGNSWELIPQNTAVGSLITRLRFNGDGSIDVFASGTGGFAPINATTPEGYFEVRMVTDRDTQALNIFIDDELIFSGFGFNGQINNVAILSDLATEGGTFDMDNLLVTDGDPNATFVSVAPSVGGVDFLSSSTVQVTLDARSLEPGKYEAVITVNSNDPETPSIDVPVNLTVIKPPTITVDPTVLETVAIDVQTDNPPTATRTFSISNSGDVDLEFDLESGLPVRSDIMEAQEAQLAQLDRSKYGVGAADFEGKLQSIVTEKAKVEKTLEKQPLLDLARQIGDLQVVDSISYDTGVRNATGQVGFGPGGPGFTAAIKFDVEVDEFVLTAVRNAYSTEGFANVPILLQIFRGGDSPATGELVLEQVVVTPGDPNGAIVTTQLGQAFRFINGESFWVVHSYPQGLEFPQGFDDSIAVTRPNTYLGSGNGGATFFPVNGFAYLTRALSEDEVFIGLSPEVGVLAPGEETEVTVTFDASNLANGVYETPIIVSSNDPVNPTVEVATRLEVTGRETIDGFLLVNADTDEILGPINDGDLVDLALFPNGTNFNIVAEVADIGTVGSVVFDLNGTTGFRTENVAPYALAGDRNGDFNPAPFVEGTNRVTATPFQGRRATGESGTARSITFEIARSVQPADITLLLVDADTDVPFGALGEGVILDLSAFPVDTNFGIVAEIGGFEAQTVVFDFNGQEGFAVDDATPFSLGGDNNGDIFPVDFLIGQNSITVTPFSGPDASGFLGTPLTLNFEVIDPSRVTFNLVDAGTDTVIGPLNDGDVLDLTNFPGLQLSVEAAVNLPNVGSVVFDFNEIGRFRVENAAPYALGGDRLGDFAPVTFLEGINTVTASAFASRGGRGAQLDTNTISFEIIGLNGGGGEEETEAITIFPNPTTGTIFVAQEGSEYDSLSARVVDVFGQTIYSNLAVDFAGGGEPAVDLSLLPSGVYIVIFTDAGGSTVSQAKVIKQ